MIKKFIRFIHNKTDASLNYEDEHMILTGRLYSDFNKVKNSKVIHDYEFKVFSQWGDDGIIQFLINTIPIENKVFVEFGVENYMESNTRFLLINNNWRGLIIDGSSDHINSLSTISSSL